MLCYAMLCCAVSCHAVLCYAMLCYAMLCYAMLCYAVLCYAMLYYAMHAVLCCHRWVQALQVLTQIAVAQSQLSKAVFDSPYAEAAFDEIVSKHVMDLTKLGQAILHSKRAPEKASTCTAFAGKVHLAHMVIAFYPNLTPRGHVCIPSGSLHCVVVYIGCHTSHAASVNW